MIGTLQGDLLATARYQLADTPDPQYATGFNPVVNTESGRRLGVDRFVDCSGLRGLLITR
jgi:hypothetical protein